MSRLPNDPDLSRNWPEPRPGSDDHLRPLDEPVPDKDVETFEDLNRLYPPEF